MAEIGKRLQDSQVDATTIEDGQGIEVIEVTEVIEVKDASKTEAEVGREDNDISFISD
jgi:hypothetical protein